VNSVADIRWQDAFGGYPVSKIVKGSRAPVVMPLISFSGTVNNEHLYMLLIEPEALDTVQPVTCSGRRQNKKTE
jgi:hypothetical protein